VKWKEVTGKVFVATLRNLTLLTCSLKTRYKEKLKSVWFFYYSDYKTDRQILINKWMDG
jgi:hypothetical protein